MTYSNSCILYTCTCNKMAVDNLFLRTQQVENTFKIIVTLKQFYVNKNDYLLIFNQKCEKLKVPVCGVVFIPLLLTKTKTLIIK